MHLPTGRRGPFFAIALACTLPLALPARAEAPAPIHVTKCDVVPQEAPRHGVAQETIRITFSIDGTVAADEAHFVASSGYNQFKGFVARGLFSKGVIIADRLLEANPTIVDFDSSRAKLGCTATYVHFVDGSSWSIEAH
jgi:hypothetical protein